MVLFADDSRFILTVVFPKQREILERSADRREEEGGGGGGRRREGGGGRRWRCALGD